MKKILVIFVITLLFGLFCNLSAARSIIIVDQNEPNFLSTIQEGINVAVDGDIVIVHPGIYVENIDFNGKKIVVASLFYHNENDIYISETIIDGNQNGSVVNFVSGEDSTSVLMGFTITNGYAERGGGIYCYASMPILENLIISDNSADIKGGGIYCYSASSSLRNIVIASNTLLLPYPEACSKGGGICCEYYSNLRLNNVTITNNSAYGGGGIFCYKSSPNLKDVTITNNSANLESGSGGGIYCYFYSDLILQNVTITNNSAGNRGGGIFSCMYSSLNLKDVTITNNSANFGGGIASRLHSYLLLKDVIIVDNLANWNSGGIEYNSNYNSNYSNFENVTIANNVANRDSCGGISCYNSNLFLGNSIIWNNFPKEIVLSGFGSLELIVAYSNIRGGINGITINNSGELNWLDGNIDEDPLFVNAEDGNYHLQIDSPCINSGIDYFEYENDILINISEDEYFDLAPDMGAYEYEFLVHHEMKFLERNEYLKIYPNPFNPITTINYELSQDGLVNIEIYNIKGQKIKTLLNEEMKKGKYVLNWDASDFSSGIYFVSIYVPFNKYFKKVILLK